MIKRSILYYVTVLVKDEIAMSCRLLTKPTVKTLQAVAEVAFNVPAGVQDSLREVLLIPRTLNVPEKLGEDGEDTEVTTAIVVAGTALGLIKISTYASFSETHRRKKKVVNETVDPETQRKKDSLDSLVPGE